MVKVYTAVFKVFQSEYIKSAPRFFGAAEKKPQCKEVSRSVRYMRDTGRSGIGSGFVKFYENYAGKCGCSVLRMDTNEKNSAARRMYAKLGYIESDMVPCVFNGIDGVNLVLLEKKLQAD